MRYNERLEGYKAFLKELESGLEFLPTLIGHIPVATTKIRATAPEWVYVEAGMSTKIWFLGVDDCPIAILGPSRTQTADEDELERNRSESIEWVKWRIAQGPPKPRLKWSERNPVRTSGRCMYEASIPVGLEGEHTIHIYAGLDDCHGYWAEVFISVKMDMDDLRPMRKLISIKTDDDPDGGYPAPFLEAEEALEGFLSAALNSLNDQQP